MPPQLLRFDCLNTPPPLGSQLATEPPATAPHATAPQSSTQTSRCTHSVPPRTSLFNCVILPRLGPSDTAPSAPIQLPARTAAPRLARRRAPLPATARCAPASAHSTQHHPMHSRRSQAPAHSAAARRCTQRTKKIQRRQLRHLCETRRQRRCPSFYDAIACTHRRPSARPSHNPPPSATAPRTPAPARSTQHHPCTAGVRKHPLPAQLLANARSVRLRSSDVSNVILPRLGASDAAPSAPM
jgi:hypothetical protein